VSGALAGLDRDQRRMLAGFKVRIGSLDLFIADVLKPEAMRWRTALRAAAQGHPMPELPPPAAVVLPTPRDDRRRLLTRLGYRAIGPQMLRVDLAERLARHAHEARAGKRETVVDEALATSLGLEAQSVAKLMREIGFRPTEGDAGWIWRGRTRPEQPKGRSSSHAFAALAGLRANG
jgi:ATP-dependent RNA helicase SUPV3L1/SUV3